MNTYFVSLRCGLAAQVQASDGLRTQAVQAESSYGTGSQGPAMSTSPSVSAWVQHSVSPNASVLYDTPGECSASAAWTLGCFSDWQVESGCLAPFQWNIGGVVFVALVSEELQIW